MKKVFLSLAVLFSVALISCGGNKAEKEAEDTMAAEAPAEVAVVDAVTTYETVNAGTDSERIDTIVAVAAQEVQAEPETPAAE